MTHYHVDHSERASCCGTRTTQINDRRNEELSLDKIERIMICDDARAKFIWADEPARWSGGQRIAPQTTVT